MIAHGILSRPIILRNPCEFLKAGRSSDSNLIKFSSSSHIHSDRSKTAVRQPPPGREFSFHTAAGPCKPLICFPIKPGSARHLLLLYCYRYSVLIESHQSVLQNHRPESDPYNTSAPLKSARQLLSFPEAPPAPYHPSECICRVPMRQVRP